jgi:hypothetical protein
MCCKYTYFGGRHRIVGPPNPVGYRLGWCQVGVRTRRQIDTWQEPLVPVCRFVVVSISTQAHWVAKVPSFPADVCWGAIGGISSLPALIGLGLESREE